MITRPLRISLGAAALGALLSLPAQADDALANRAVFELGPIKAGQDLFVHLRTQEPNAFAALFLSLDGTPTPLPGFFNPPLNLNVGGAQIFFRQLDATGRDLVQAPTVPGQFGPTFQNFPVFGQYIVQAVGGPKIVSNRESVDFQPFPPIEDYLVDQAATRLPAGYDQFGGNEIVHVDLDRDGDEDLVLANEFEVVFWINDGTGVFTDDTAARFTQTGQAVGPLAMADVNGDRILDLIVGGGFDDLMQVPDRQYLGTPSGTFLLDDGALPAPSGLSGKFEFGDVDGDGDPDLVIAAGQGQHLPTPGGLCRLLINDGAGNWTSSAAFEALAWNDATQTANAARFGDIDNDGDLDLYVARIDSANGGARNVLLENDGTGNFTDISAQVSPVFFDNSGDATLADIDLDGYLDIVVANSFGSQPSSLSGDVYFNQGASNPGFFVEDPTSDLEFSTPADFIRLSVKAADIDQDGDPDLLVGVHDLFLGADQLLLMNQGGAQEGTLGDFVRQTWFDPGNYISYGFDAFDMDADGDLDVIQLANGVITGDPGQQFTARLFENQGL